jgi:hypothetical protein
MTSLKLCLEQNALTCCVRDGVLIITAKQSEEILAPVTEDPFLITGHCLLAMFAAALGGVLARFISGVSD